MTPAAACAEMDDDVIRLLAQHNLILYLKATAEDEKELIARAEQDPKPLYYQEAFLDEQLAITRVNAARIILP